MDSIFIRKQDQIGTASIIALHRQTGQSAGTDDPDGVEKVDRGHSDEAGKTL
jgi:hypothetical protein